MTRTVPYRTVPVPYVSEVFSLFLTKIKNTVPYYGTGTSKVFNKNTIFPFSYVIKMDT